MNIKEKAIEIHESGFNCAQSVLCACGDYTGIDEKTALAISAGFGGGMRCGEICGALSGAVLAMGAALPFNDADDAEAKVRIAALAKQSAAMFEDSFGCLRCAELKEAGKPCMELIAYGAELAEQMIIGNKGE